MLSPSSLREALFACTLLATLFSALSSFYLTLIGVSGRSYLFFSFLYWLQWVPGDSFLLGNNAADELARLVTLLLPSAVPYSLSPLTSPIHSSLSRSGGVLFHQNSLTHRLLKHPLSCLCCLVMLVVSSLLLLLVTRPLPRAGSMAEDHGAPEAGQFSSVWTRGRRETESCQRVQSWTVQNEMGGVLGQVSSGTAGRILDSANPREIEPKRRLCPLQRRRERTQ